MSKTNPISAELVDIQNFLIGCYQPDCSLQIENTKADSFVRRISVLANLARNLEDQLAVHRVQQEQKADAATLEDLAGDYLLSATNDTVISVDFKIKKGGAA